MPLCRIATVALFLAPAASHAAGLWNFDQGAANYARGGANIAAPSDPTAVYLNPAALAGQRGFQLHAMADFIQDERGFARAPDRIGQPRYCCEKTRYAEVKNTEPVFPSPGIWLSGNLEKLGLPQLTLGAALYGPPRSDAELPAGGAQRYSQTYSANLQVHSALAVGYELPWRRTRLGVTGMMIDQQVVTGLAFNTFFGQPEERGWDADVDVKARDANIPTFILGASTEVIPQLTFAMSYQHPYDVKAEGRATGELGDELGELATLRNGPLAVEFEMPSLTRAALRFDAPSGLWDVEAAFVYEAWSRNDEVRFKPQGRSGLALLLDGGISRRVEDIAVPTHFRDTWSTRVGGEIEVLPSVLSVRLGSFFERSAISAEWINMGNFDLDKAGLSAGVRWDIKQRGWVELGGGYQHWFTVKTSNSKVRIIDPLENEQRWTVANGTYTNQRLHGVIGAGIRL